MVIHGSTLLVLVCTKQINTDVCVSSAWKCACGCVRVCDGEVAKEQTGEREKRRNRRKERSKGARERRIESETDTHTYTHTRGEGLGRGVGHSRNWY